MGRTIFSNETRPVHCEDDRQMLNRDVMNHIVVCALEKRRINRTDGANSAGSETGGKRHRVSFSNSNIEEAVGKYLGKCPGSCATRHCSGDGDNAWVFLRQLDYALAECRRVCRVRNGNLALLSSRRVVSRRKGVPFLDVLARRKSFPLLGNAVN